MGTMYFSLNSLRGIYQKEKSIDASRKNLDSMYYLLSLWTGKSRLTGCGPNRLSFERDLPTPSDSNREQKPSEKRREMKVVLEKVAMRDNVHYLLTRSLRVGQGGSDASKRIRYLFSHKGLADNDIARLRAEYSGFLGTAESELKQKRAHYALEWRCPKQNKGVLVLPMRAYRLRGFLPEKGSKPDKVLVRQRSFLFHWQLSPKLKER